MAVGGLSLLTGLLIAWAVVTSVLILLMIYRGIIGMHQEDQVFLSAGTRGFERENAETEARIVHLRPFIWAITALSAVLAAATVVVWLMQAAQRF
ncbi:MAG: hypothetical protein ACRD1L_08970 [Terriglobales bacterium]